MGHKPLSRPSVEELKAELKRERDKHRYHSIFRGTLYINNIGLEEPHLTEKALGECNIELPFQVPDGRYFVMGDHRSTSVDS